ncbi:MAG: transposase [Proteobacteria bacterium]|nr:MAG: transposase [Pseudomonadota bacterium]
MHQTPHGCALRRGRVSEAGRIYLVTTVTRGRIPLFADFALSRAAIGELRRCDHLGRCATLAFMLMPDHLHWLLQLAGDDLPRVVGLFKANSAKAIDRQRGTQREHVWQPGFHDHSLRMEEDLAATARYIIANPLRAGLVRRIGDYPHWDAIWL